ncbi:HlyD family secretion protein [Chitinophaga horti]|uniref:HlyD family secretion protein n=1 Tax=Chitinophaga horti TaxID=2920382 RepID=A0ABY6IX63_9BACT|nr:HlyD family secretion protein [Chitinophaga horti]UYQ91977.1 HlyD family secretion protein [Chitinophaga horti]
MANHKEINHKAHWENLGDKTSRSLLRVRKVLRFERIMLFVFIFFIIILFLPWRQTIPGKGTVTALRPQDRPQTVQNQIGGRIERWYVSEGQEVKLGDTILLISEISQSYFDPELPTRLREQLSAKQGSEEAAKQKMRATQSQIEALNRGLTFQLVAAENKVKQAINYVQSDSADLVAVQQFYRVSQARLERYEQGFKDGLFSLTDIETRRLNVQNDNAKLIAQENKLNTSRQGLLNAQIELDNIRAKYQESLAKAQSDMGTALSGQATAQGDIAKLRNEIANIDFRRGMYVVRAPQDGYVIKTLKAGIGENIKEGESVATLQPKDPQVAAEIYVNAMDVPLIADMSEVRLQFEGWPSVQFSGWPSVAVGTFAGKVFSIDRMASADGTYRVLVKQVTPVPKADEPWPIQLRQGSGVYGRVILNSVPVWYEIWRQLNGFPPSLKEAPKADAATGK